MKLRNNHARVLKDVCNPSPDTNIDGKPLTQLELVRVAPEHERFADEALHEIEQTALGAGPDATHKRGSTGVGSSGDVSGRSHSGDASGEARPQARYECACSRRNARCLRS